MKIDWLSNRYLQGQSDRALNHTKYLIEINDEQTASSLNFATTVIFILTFAWFLYLVKKNVSKYVSFYVLRRDYLRMRLIEKEENINAPTVEVIPNLDEFLDDPKLHHKSA